MTTYNIYFSTSVPSNDEKILSLAIDFAEQLFTEALIVSYNVHRITDPGNFEGMPKYHMAVNFRSSGQMSRAFMTIREQYMHVHPHSELMRLASEFKVTFSEGLNIRSDR